MKRNRNIAMQFQNSKQKKLARFALTIATLVCAIPSIVQAQQAGAMSMPMDHSKMPGMDHVAMPGMDHGAMPGMDHGSMPGMGKDQAMPMDHSEMPGMDHGGMQGMDHGSMSGMDKGAMPGMGKDQAVPMDHSKMPGMDHGGIQAMDHGSMPGMGKGGAMQMDMGAMQGGSAPADARDPDTYADGLTLGPMHGMDMADNARYGQLLLDRLEWTHANDGTGQALDAQAWFGGDLDKLWLKVDGERSGGKLDTTRTEALWNHAIATYWGLQTGVRHDLGDGPSRTWAAFGVQGLAPYWFDLQATAYVGQSGRTAARIEAEYDVLLTQRLILQPNVKADFYGRQDRERGIGSGLSDVEAGLRLRYEITRKIAPYIGVIWKGSFGDTANFAREEGKRSKETQVVAGVRLWF